MKLSKDQECNLRCIAKRIGDKLWDAIPGCALSENAEFNRVTLVAKDGSEFSVIYPAQRTSLSVGELDLQQRYRIKRFYCKGRRGNRYATYLMPRPDLATKVSRSYRWLEMFDGDDNDGVDLALITNAERVILETFDVQDQISRKRLVYEASTDQVRVEYQ